MLDDLAGRKTGERIQILRERRGLSRPVLAGLVGKSASWLKGIESGRRLPPRLPLLVQLAEALGVGDVAVLAGTDMTLGGNGSVPILSFAHIPHEATPAVREAVRMPLLTIPDDPTAVAVSALASRSAEAWRLWHTSRTRRRDVGRILPGLLRDARVAARRADGSERRQAHGVLADVYALAQHELVWASEPELIWIVADRAVSAAQEADRPVPLAGAAWTMAIVHRHAGDVDSAVSLAHEGAELLRPYLQHGERELRAMYGALQLHMAASCARAGREGDAWHYWDDAASTAEQLGAYHHPWTQFGKSNVDVHAVTVAAELSKSATARERAEQIDPETIPSLERRSRFLVEIARSYHQRRDYTGTLHWLKEAHAISTDAVYYSPLARQMVSDVIDHGGPLTDRDARQFGRMLGLPL